MVYKGRSSDRNVTKMQRIGAPKIGTVYQNMLNSQAWPLERFGLSLALPRCGVTEMRIVPETKARMKRFEVYKLRKCVTNLHQLTADRDQWRIGIS
jgi:hypothetical protein